MLYFNNCDIQINGTGLMAQNARISSSNSLESIKPLGRLKGLELSPEGPVKNDFSATYWINIDKDPCYQEVLSLKDHTDFNQAQPQVIKVAGLSGAFYMSSYAISIRDNSTIQARVSYVGFDELSGTVSKRSEVSSDYISSFSGLAHSWTTFIESDAGSLDVPILKFSYDFRPTMQPVFAIGSKTPVQVIFNTYEEEIKIEKDVERQIKFYGESGCALFDACAQNPRVRLFKLGYLCDETLTDAMNFDVSGYRITSNVISADTNDFVKSEFSIKKTS